MNGEHEAHEHAAAAAEFAIAGSRVSDEVARGVTALVSELGAAVVAAGCRLIGHVKCFVQSQPDGHLYVSLTSLEHGPSSQGQLPAVPHDLRLTLAAIVYGLTPETLETLLTRCVEQRFPDAQRQQQ